MKKFILLVTIWSVSQTVSAEDCFPSQGDVVEARETVSLQSELGHGKGERTGELLPHEKVTVTAVKVVSGIQIWVQVKNETGKSGWAYQGYWSDITHGVAKLCYVENLSLE